MNLMQSFTFVHAADLHLDAVLPSPSGSSDPAVEKLLAGAVFTALERLVCLCLAEKADFLVLAGDVFHGGSGSLKAAFDLAAAFKRLGESGIEVFWARGNHDSLSQSDDAMRWPENVHIFSAEGESLVRGEAEISGLSHKSRHERANLAEKLKSGGRGFKLGVLHCAVNGAQGAHASYAPCNLSDLTGGDMDYWALGHVHGPAVLSERPLVVYSGSLQGLHVNETGPHGCYVVKVGADGEAKARFAALAPVRWERLTLDISPAESLDALEDLALEGVRGLREAIGREETPPDLLLLRLELAGRSPLDALLRKAGSVSALTERLNLGLAALDGDSGLMARLKDISLSTSPDIDVEALKQNDDLVGETLRRAGAVAERLEELAASGVLEFSALEAALADEAWGPDLLAALGELYGERRLQEAEALPTTAELAAMAREAASLCLHLFEVEP